MKVSQSPNCCGVEGRDRVLRTWLLIAKLVLGYDLPCTE